MYILNKTQELSKNAKIIITFLLSLEHARELQILKQFQEILLFLFEQKGIGQSNKRKKQILESICYFSSILLVSSKIGKNNVLQLQ